MNHKQRPFQILQKNHANHTAALSLSFNYVFPIADIARLAMSDVTHDRFDLSDGASMGRGVFAVPFDPEEFHVPWHWYYNKKPTQVLLLCSVRITYHGIHNPHRPTTATTVPQRIPAKPRCRYRTKR